MKVECMACSGTGLYRGFAEREGYPVICIKCRGTGVGPGTKEYTGRKRKEGVKGIRTNPTGLFIHAPDDDSPYITYEEFEKLVPAPPAD